jgi:hypothetical protein
MVLESRIYNFYFGFAFLAGISIDLCGADMPGLNTLSGVKTRLSGKVNYVVEDQIIQKP